MTHYSYHTDMALRHLSGGSERALPPLPRHLLYLARCSHPNLPRQKLAMLFQKPRRPSGGFTFEFVYIYIIAEMSVLAAQLGTTVSSAKIRSMERKSMLPVVTTTTSAALRTYLCPLLETKHSFLLVAARKTFPLHKFNPTSHKHSLQRSRKRKSSSAP